MARNNLLHQDYFRLFLRREGSAIFGRHFSNLWIVTAMLTAMLLALSFSSASMKYLRYKMEDPFIRWLDIKNQGYGTVFNELKDILDDPEIQDEFGFSSVREDYQFSFFFYEPDSDAKHYITCRMFENYDSPIFRAILDPDNVVDGLAMTAEILSRSSIGVILTENALRILHYSEPPRYIQLSTYCSVTGETAGLKVVNGYARVPIPVLAVVKRLPGSVDMVSTASLYSGINSFSFDMGAPENEDYAYSLLYYVPKGQTIDSYALTPYDCDALRSYGDGSVARIDTEGMDLDEIVRIADDMESRYSSMGLIRLFDYHLSDYPDLPDFPAYLSVQFENLKNIKGFSVFVSARTEDLDPERRISVDVTVTNAKENFNAVSTMASILSWALIVFSIMSILLFIVNLLQSYFLKVKRNLGTFKAFGMGNHELIAIYSMIIMTAMVCAIAIALVVVSFLQGMFQLFGIVHEAGYPYWSLMNWKTLEALAAVLIAVYLTVRIVMGKLLRATPGDLIYDRQ